MLLVVTKKAIGFNIIIGFLSPSPPLRQKRDGLEKMG